MAVVTPAGKSRKKKRKKRHDVIKLRGRSEISEFRPESDTQQSRISC